MKAIKRDHMKALNEHLCVQEGDVASLKCFQTLFYEQVRGLLNQGVPAEDWHVFLMTEKLDIQTRREWENKTAGKTAF